MKSLVQPSQPGASDLDAGHVQIKIEPESIEIQSLFNKQYKCRVPLLPSEYSNIVSVAPTTIIPIHFMYIRSINGTLHIPHSRVFTNKSTARCSQFRDNVTAFGRNFQGRLLFAPYLSDINNSNGQTQIVTAQQNSQPRIHQ